MALHLNKLTATSKQGVRSFAVFKNFSGSEIESEVSNRNGMHITAARSYPCAAALKLPDNYQDVNASEMGQFSPLRSRDISGSVISSSNHFELTERFPKFDITVDSDPHIGPYDCRGAVNLSSSMQSNVPSPFGGQGSILGMPGSQWGQGYKYVSDYLHNSHYLNLRNTYSRALHSVSIKPGTKRFYHTQIRSYNPHNKLFDSYNTAPSYKILGNKLVQKLYSSKQRSSNTQLSQQEQSEITKTSDTALDNVDKKSDAVVAPSKVEQLKNAVKAYGSTVIVFHVTISLVSLGSFYLLVSSGLDVAAFMNYLGYTDGVLASKITANAGTFVVAYAVHKVFAPVRIGITLTATPLIVRYLRKVGVLATPLKKP